MHICASAYLHWISLAGTMMLFLQNEVNALDCLSCTLQANEKPCLLSNDAKLVACGANAKYCVTSAIAEDTSTASLDDFQPYMGRGCSTGLETEDKDDEMWVTISNTSHKMVCNLMEPGKASRVCICKGNGCNSDKWDEIFVAPLLKPKFKTGEIAVAQTLGPNSASKMGIPYPTRTTTPMASSTDPDKTKDKGSSGSDGTDSSLEKGGLSTGALIGIGAGIGALLLLSAIGACVWYYLANKKKKKKKPEEEEDDDDESVTETQSKMSAESADEVFPEDLPK